MEADTYARWSGHFNLKVEFKRPPGRLMKQPATGGSHREQQQENTLATVQRVLQKPLVEI